MKRIERVGIIVKTLSDSPNKIYSLNQFCKMFNAAKSTVSEDVSAARAMLSKMGLGTIETIAGAKGGIRYIPKLSDCQRDDLRKLLKEKLSKGNRILGGGFLYTSDIMFDSHIVGPAATLFAEKFQSCQADYVVTIETKGIPLALMTAHMLNLPLVVVRRESRVSEGSTVSINYFSGSTDRIQKLSLAKRAVEPGRKAIIIDDFMRAGGSIKGIKDVLSEFDVAVVGTGVVIAALEPEKKIIEDYYPLLYLGSVDEQNKTVEII